MGLIIQWINLISDSKKGKLFIAHMIITMVIYCLKKKILKKKLKLL